SDERVRAETIKRILADYVVREAKRPICIAVFGPPGSGKSAIVKQILESLGSSYPDRPEINLSQIESESALGDAVLQKKELFDIFQKRAKGKGWIPVIFFDEFDTALDDKAYSWLKSFLSLMQDGNIQSR